jgi:hypothetical protein
LFICNIIIKDYVVNHLLSEILQRKENTEGAIKNRQSRDTARAMQHLAQYTELRQTKQKVKHRKVKDEHHACF